MIIATIPARGGSKGVPKKNLKELCGIPLIAYSIEAAKQTAQIDRVIVSTDSDEIAKVAVKYGAEVPFLRPSEYARDDSPDNEHIMHAINWLKDNENITPEMFVHLRPTTPLRNPHIIDKAITKFKKNALATSLRSAHLCSESPFKWFLLKNNGFFTGINTDDMELVNKPRQSFPDVYIPNGYVDIISVDYVNSTGKLHGGSVLSFITDPCLEVDTEHDFKQLQIEMQITDSILFKGKA